MPNFKVVVEDYQFSGDVEEISEKTNANNFREDLPDCPLCGEAMIPSGGCFYCFNCGYSPCTD